MTRLLVFDGPRAGKRFELLLAAMEAGGDGKGDRTPAVIRKEARLLTLFDQISVPSLNGGPSRVLTGEASLSLAQEDFDLLQQYTEKTPWTPRVSRDVVDLWDWLSTAEKQD